MKKTYITPSLQVTRMNTEVMICESPLNVFSNKDTRTDGFTSAGRERGGYSDDDSYDW